EWIMSFDYGKNGGFTNGNGQTGWNQNGASPFKGEDEFNARSRVHLQLHAVASEALSGTVFFEIGDIVWGKASTGGALGADGTIVEVKNAYLDWMLPGSNTKVRMGIQSLRLPSFTTGSNILGDDVAGIVASHKFNDNVSVTGMWLRPFNDNYAGETGGIRQNYMDNMDIGALVVPLSFDGVKVTPWGMYAGIGPNTFGNGDFSSLKAGFTAQGTSWQGVQAGLLPAGGAIRKDGSPVGKRLHDYGNAVWLGLTGEVTEFDPFRLAWDFNYGSVSYDDSHYNRQGWLGNLLFEYKTGWGIPGVYGWYSSGDDGNPANGSERMPHLSVINTHNNFSHFAFNGSPYLARERLLGNQMSGTWGIGARLKDVSFIDDLRHTLRLNYIGGTNSPTMAKRYMTPGGNTDYISFADGPNSQAWGTGPLYMTTNDSAVEIGLTTEYQVYENLKVHMEAAYLATLLDKSRSVWGTSVMNGKGGSDDMRDPWSLNLGVVYTF
ncbi:MAG: outer membrane homotrimeric porin, partial [Desulfovibrio sp.]|nr:outer membrane homotrimeric porin [Desulfovibrio sp.]